MSKGSIRFDDLINVEVAVDPTQAAGAKLLSAVNLVDGQELGGGGDFSVAEITLTNSTGETLLPPQAAFIDNNITIGSIILIGPGPYSLNIVYPNNNHGDLFFDNFDDEVLAVATSGNIEYSGAGDFIITGDGTITITSK